MTNRRFYCREPLATITRLKLPEDVARHACRVLRLRAGDELVLFDGRGGEYASRISQINREQVTVDVLEWRDVECEAPIEVSLVQALQAGEKMDTTIQKAVELGVARIVPVISRRSLVRLIGQRAERRIEHWQQIAIAASEQCGRNRVPAVDALTELSRWLDRPAATETLRLLLVPRSAHTLDTIAPPVSGGQVQLLIGPEGGLTTDEVQMAEKAGFVSIRLGPRILRTETVGLAALAAMQCLWGDFRGGLHHV